MTPLHWSLCKKIGSTKGGTLEKTAGRTSRIEEAEELLGRDTEDKNQVDCTLNNYKIENKTLQKLAKEKLTMFTALCE